MKTSPIILCGARRDCLKYQMELYPCRGGRGAVQKLTAADHPRLAARHTQRQAYLSGAAIFPPSTVVTSAVVFSASACARNAFATSSAVTSRASRLPLM